MIKMKKISLSTTQIILFSFIITILLGSFLLFLPISTVQGESVSYIDALFTSTTSTCVTGLVTVPTVATWSTFGQIVILCLIQIGGLCVITVISGVMIMLNRKMGIEDRLLIQDAFNLNTMSGLVKFVKKVLFGTLIVEGIGAAFYMLVFVPDFGVKGIWISIFNSVSAFCNAGIDIISENSLCNYATNPIVNFVTVALIILGGIGFIVWWDIFRVFQNRKFNFKKAIKGLTFHSKIALSATLILFFCGAFLVFILEYNNSETIGNMSLWDKIQTSFFQSVTTRTAGFASLPQENLTNATSVVSIILMIIGGSPVGTAGGIKTVTIVVLLASSLTTIKNKERATLFNRSISTHSIRKAIAVVTFFMIIMLTSVILLLATTNVSMLDAVYESASATATVGLSRNLTSSLNDIGKVIIILTMYLGRVGPISLAVALGSKKVSQNIINDPVEEISIG